jgi:hypothetical protein
LLTFRHVNVELDKRWLKDQLGFDFSGRRIEKLREFDNAGDKNLQRLDDIGRVGGAKLISEDDFPAAFNV